MNLLSLCTGYGGLDLAVEAVTGAHTRWVSDIDRDACAVQAVRFPDAEQLGDLKQIDWSALAGQVDVLTAGYPCQPFSHAGSRKGTEDERHLWPWIADAIRILRPRLVVLENVAGHLVLGFDSVLADLAAMGMSARWGVVRASDTGAPHRRERIFVVAYPSSQPWFRHISCSRQGELAERETGRATGEPPAADADSVAAGRDGRAALGTQGEDQGRREPNFDHRSAHGMRGAAADTDGGGQQRDTEQHRSSQQDPSDRRSQRRHADGCCVEIAADADSSRSQRTEPTQRCDLPVRRVAADAYGQAGDTTGSASSALPKPGTIQRSGRRSGVGAATDWGRFEPAIRRWECVLGRGAPAPLVDGTRQLNAHLVEWMMGLPEGWVTDIIPNRRALRVLGNGVVPQQAELALRGLLR